MIIDLRNEPQFVTGSFDAHAFCLASVEGHSAFAFKA